MATGGASPNDLKVKRSTPILRNVEAHLDLQQLELVFPGDILDTIRRLQKENDLKLKETSDGFKVIGTLECLNELENSLASSDPEANRADVYILSQKAIHPEISKMFDDIKFSLGQIRGNTTGNTTIESSMGKFVYFLIDKKEQLVEMLNDSNARIRLKDISNDKVRIKIDKGKQSKVEAEIRHLYEASNTMMVEFTRTVNTQHSFEVANRIRDKLQPELVMLRAVPNTKEDKASPNPLDKSWVVTVLTLNSKGARAKKDLDRIIQQCTSHMDVSTILRKLCNAKIENPSVRIGSVSSPIHQMSGFTASPELQTDGPSQLTDTSDLQKNGPRKFTPPLKLLNDPRDFNATPELQTNDASKFTASPELQNGGSSHLTATSEQQTNGQSDLDATPELQTNGQPELKDTNELNINGATSTVTVLANDTVVNEEGESASPTKEPSKPDDQSNVREIVIGDDDVIEYMMQFRNAEMCTIADTYGVNIRFDKKEGLLVIHGKSHSLEEAELKLAHLAQDVFALRTQEIDISTLPQDIDQQKLQEGIRIATEQKFLVRPNDKSWFIMGPGASLDSCVQALKLHFGLVAPRKSRQRKMVTSDVKDRPIHHSSNGPASLPASINNITPAAYRASSGLVVYAWETDITKLRVDVVVNAANEMLHHGAGVAYAIARAAGPKLETESRQLIKNYGNLHIAEVRITTAGRMPSNAVFHTVGPQWVNFTDKNVCSGHLMNTFYNCLIRANENKHFSIAFPAISSGVYGVPKYVVATAAVRALTYFIQKFPFSHLKHVHLVDIQQDIVLEFQHELTRNASFQAFSYRDFSRWGAHEALYKSNMGKQGFEQGQNSWTTKTLTTTITAAPSAKDRETSMERLTSEFDDIDIQRNPNILQHGKEGNMTDRASVSQGNLKPDKPPADTMDWENSSGQAIAMNDKYPLKVGTSRKTDVDKSFSTRSYSQVAAGSSSKPNEIDLPLVHNSEKSKEKSGEKTKTTKDAKSKEKEVDDCSICLDKPTNPVTLEKCNHVFCKDCIDESFKKTQPKCPNCGVVYGEIRGIQPDGTMKVDKERGSLAGYEGHGTLVIRYDIPSGVQTEIHPNPGERFTGAHRIAYLPDCKEGIHVLGLLKRAFEARMIFTVGRSSTTGRDNHVIWNCIHHKTSRYGGSNSYGYPDPTYLERVKDELAAQGFK